MVERMSVKEGQIRAGAGGLNGAKIEIFAGLKAVLLFLDSRGKCFVGDETLVDGKMGALYSCVDNGSLVAVTDKQELGRFKGLTFSSVGGPLFVNRKVLLPSISVMWCELGKDRMPARDGQEYVAFKGCF